MPCVKMIDDTRIAAALNLLDLHYDTFYSVVQYAEETGHPVPTDTRAWSQILVSILCGVKGLGRKKGTDLVDGSDVKAANTWKAIDTPRFNGVIKAGTLSDTSGRLESLDSMPHLYLVLWDETSRNAARCRIWVVRPQHDQAFRAVCETWYSKRASGEIKSNNFQLHPPRGLDTDIIGNSCGTLSYPLYFSAERTGRLGYELVRHDPLMRINGRCLKP